jgi:hypothetical protein
MGRFLLWTIAAILGLSRLSVAAEPWFELKDFGPVTQRVAVTVENPADVAVEAALVHLPLAELPRRFSTPRRIRSASSIPRPNRPSAMRRS